MNISITYSWEFNKKQWEELWDFLEDYSYNQQKVEKIVYDPMSMFYYMRNLQVPTVSEVKIDDEIVLANV